LSEKPNQSNDGRCEMKEVKISMSTALELLVFLAKFTPNDNYEPSADCNKGHSLLVLLKSEMSKEELK
jgi:hypothetical protein